MRRPNERDTLINIAFVWLVFFGLLTAASIALLLLFTGCTYETLLENAVIWSSTLYPNQTLGT